MSALLDTSVLVGALLDNEPHHAACLHVLRQPDVSIHAHALNETFATLTGGSVMRFRTAPELAAQAIRDAIVAQVSVIVLDATDMVAAHREAKARGVRGGAIYDFMHLVAARKAGVTALYTLDTGNFTAFHRPGDPEIRRP